MAMVPYATNPCVQTILGKYLGECQAIKDAVTSVRDAQAEAEDRYANARTQQQAESAEADIKSSTEALAQVLSTLVVALTLNHISSGHPLEQRVKLMQHALGGMPSSSARRGHTR